MGLGGISIWQMLIVLAIVVMIFGTKKLRNAGGDLGSAIKNFKNNVKDGEAEVSGKPEQLEQADRDGSGPAQAKTGDADFVAKASTGGVDPTVDNSKKTQ